MDVELWLDFDEVSSDNKVLVMQKFYAWYNDGSEVRHSKKSFGTLTELEATNRFLIDFRYVDAVPAIRNLHARIRNLGVKVFVHFIH